MQRGAVVAARFVVEAPAGSGAMGTVVKAKDSATGSMVALKILRWDAPEHVARFEREAHLLAEIRHPGIVRYVAHGRTDDGAPFLAMEWLDGETLADRLASRGVSTREAVAMAKQVAAALAALHARGVVHRDLKPGNLMLVTGPAVDVRLLDLGIARVSTAAGDLTVTGTTLGTPGYIAPEQARGERAVDARADVYALGALLFKCLTGRTPFVGDDALAVLVKSVLDEPPRLRDLAVELPDELDDLCARMLAKEPGARPTDGLAALAELEALELPEGDDAPRSTLTPSLTSTERRILYLLLGRADVDAGAEAARDEVLRHVVERHRGALEILADGSLLAAFSEPPSRAATDAALRAARCALALCSVFPGAALALITGRGVSSERSSLGEAIDQGVRLLATPAPGIVLDDAVAGLLEASHTIETVGSRRQLVAARPDHEVRTLLGRPTPYVGREHELGTLRSLAEACFAQPSARVAVVTAPAGTGKSRLRHELVAEIARRRPDASVWVGRGDPMRAGSPFGLLGQALRRAAEIVEGEGLEPRREKLAAFVAGRTEARGASDLTGFIGELCGVPFPDDGNVPLTAARRDPQLMADQLTRAFEELVVGAAARGPLILVLEDLHWGDLPTVRLVDAALRAAADLPLFVLALGRSEVHELFPRLWAQRSVQPMRLDQLSRSASERLARTVLGDGADAATVARVVEQAGGNAFYLEELIRAVAEGRGTDLPESVLAMVQARLDGLPAEGRQVLRAASVFGQRFREDGVVALMGKGRAPAVRAWLVELCEGELLHRRRDGARAGAEYAFRHGLVRDAAYAMLTEADRALGHQLAGRFLERDGRHDAAALAEHFERGREPELAALWYRTAADQALGGDDIPAAVRRLERALALEPTASLRGEILAGLAEACLWSGDHARAGAAGLEALPLLERGTAPWCAAARVVVMAAGRMLDEATLERAVGDLEGLPPESAARAPYLAAIACAANQLTFAGRYADAERLAARLPLHSADAGVDAGTGAWIERAHAWLALARGEIGDYSARMNAAAEQLERAGDVRNGAAMRVNVGYAAMLLGDFAGAERILRDVCAQAERRGIHAVGSVARHNRGLALARMGRLDEALAEEEAALDAFQRQNERRLESGARTYLAMILAEQGDLARAEAEARIADTMLAENNPARVMALAVLASVLLARGDAPGAHATALAAMALLDELGTVDEGEAQARLVAAEASMAVGDADGARRTITKAQARLWARAARLRDTALSERFLRDVPENARTLVLAREWLSGA